MEILSDSFYASAEWRAVRDRVLDRDGGRCTVARLLGGQCRGSLHAHHIEKRVDRPELALDETNLATVCAAHHPTWEALRLFVTRARRQIPPCKHRHPYRAGREACERERAEKLGIVLV